MNFQKDKENEQKSQIISLPFLTLSYKLFFVNDYLVSLQRILKNLLNLKIYALKIKIEINQFYKKDYLLVHKQKN